MKKIISLILAAALVVTSLGLYGCQKTGQEVTEPTDATEAAAATECTKATEAKEATVPGSTVPEATENTEPQTDGSTDKDKAGSTDGNDGSTGDPPATQPPTTEPPATQPPATKPPETETPDPTEHTHSYAVNSSTPASCSSEGSNTYTCSCGDSYTESIPMTAHNWVHQHQDEVKHQESGCMCICGAKFPTTAAWGAHVDSYDNLEALTNHGSNGSYTEWVIDTPAKDWDECSVCGATK